MSDTSHPHCSEGSGSVSCRDCAEFLMDYLDGTLPPDEHRKFETHLSLCLDCVIYLENYRKTVAMTCAQGKKAECEAAKEQPIPRRIVEAILAARKNS